MKVTIGKKGLNKTWQQEHPEETKCVHCKGIARIGFVAHERIEEKLPLEEYVCSLHTNEPISMWLHDCCTVAVYFCKKCLKTTSLYNQG